MIETRTHMSEREWNWKSDPDFLLQLTKDLRRLAVARLRSGDRAISLSSLVQESLVKLIDAKCLNKTEDRGYVYAMAARVMRNVMVDHIRARNALKRRGKQTMIELDRAIGFDGAKDLEILAVHEALERLSERNPRQAQVVEMKFFADYSMKEIAKYLGFAKSTVESDWTEAKKFLARILTCEVSLQR